MAENYPRQPISNSRSVVDRIRLAQAQIMQDMDNDLRRFLSYDDENPMELPPVPPETLQVFREALTAAIVNQFDSSGGSTPEQSQNIIESRLNLSDIFDPTTSSSLASEAATFMHPGRRRELQAKSLRQTPPPPEFRDFRPLNRRSPFYGIGPLAVPRPQESYNDTRVYPMSPMSQKTVRDVSV